MAEAKKEIENLSIDQLKAALESGNEVLLIDLRELQERVGGGRRWRPRR